jgi:hypothetical protein
MHRDVECGTFQRDKIAEHIFVESFDVQVRKSVHKEWRRIDRATAGKVSDPFSAMMNTRLPVG